MRGPWDGVKDIDTPLRKRPIDSPGSDNIEDSLKFFEEQGAPKSQLIVELAFYGKTFTLLDPSQHSLHAPFSGDGDPGPYTNDPGHLVYYEICQKVQQEGWTREYDNIGAASYAYKGNQWVGYDDEQSIAAKVNFIKQKGYGGAMIWAIDEDDFRGVCGPKHALIGLVANGLR